MARRKLDNLDRDVIRAERLGYGCHYGQYKADHPHTRAEGSNPAPIIEAQEIPNTLKSCRMCGKMFDPEELGYTRARKFCSNECVVKSKRMRDKKYKAQRRVLEYA